MPPTRPMARAWLETSMATSVTPRSRITASRDCISGASGVVKPVLISASPTMVATVPMSPFTRPAAARPARMRNVVVVLPLVPVTPSIRSPRDGVP